MRAACGKRNMADGFLPSTNQGLLAWTRNFYTVGNPIATTLNLTAAEFTSFNGLISTYAADLAACDPGVRSKAAVLQKDISKAALTKSARSLARIAEAAPAMTDPLRAQLGLTVRAHPVPQPPPAFAPQVDLMGVDGSLVKVKLHNSQVTGTRARPKGVKGAAIFSHVGTSAPTDPTQYKFEGTTSKTSIDVLFPASVTPGSTVFITAAWCNERLEGGPLATPVQAVIQFSTGGSAVPPAVAG